MEEEEEEEEEEEGYFRWRGGKPRGPMWRGGLDFPSLDLKH